MPLSTTDQVRVAEVKANRYQIVEHQVKEDGSILVIYRTGYDSGAGVVWHAGLSEYVILPDAVAAVLAAHPGLYGEVKGALYEAMQSEAVFPSGAVS